MTKFNVLEFIANNAGLSIAEAIEKAYELGKTEMQPCEDCVSREAAIDVVRKWFDKIQLNGDICLDGIVSLPSVTPKARWIPCSEEPTKGIYLITRQYKQHRYVEMATYDGDDPQDVFSWEGYSDEWKLHRAEHKVLAWQPLPQPYKEEEE